MDIKYSVRIDNGSTVSIVGADTLQINAGDCCVFQREHYVDYGEIVRVRGPLAAGEDPREFPTLLRRATVRDQGTANENLSRARAALRTAGHHVELLGLEMNLLNAHYSFDGKYVIIQFTADGRVDFRELVKELTRSLSCRIELRQIGVRDETAICGGIGICGQVLCCSRFIADFSSVNVKMAKDQDLSLTPSTISGACGRLKCCLRYEHAGYLEMGKTMPRRGEACVCPKGRGRISDRNLLTQQVTVTLEDSGASCVCQLSELSPVVPERKKESGPAPVEAENHKKDSAGKPSGGENRNSQNRRGNR